MKEFQIPKAKDLFFSKKFQIPLQQQVLQEYAVLLETHISVEILCAGIKQIATLCYHQYKLNGANLKDGALNKIPLNIRKPKLTAT